MRVWQKKELLKMINLLSEAHAVIRGDLLKRRYDNVIQLLQECQFSAEKVGDTIEAIEGEGTTAVAYLENYCELLYQISEHPGEEDAYRRFKQLEKSLGKVKKSIDREFRSDKLKVLFLPYKASMWDSMESIWMSALEDGRCECQVVPIPYYEKRKDGQLGKMHDESDRFPDYVPVIRWYEYQLAKEHPDLIYFHNPYDQYNYVTSVMPDFYSEKLRENAGLLVYVPYFVNGGALSKTFYEFPAYDYADYIIAQSDKEKLYYAESARNKILPLGSPKFDKIINLSRDDLKIPAEWRVKISGKKVFFINTSISLILQYGTLAIEKLINICSCFSEKKDCVLLWRPHPLLQETLNSLRQDLLPLYERWKREMEKMPNVIIDQTADITISVKVADAYIGEESSSIVHLFGIEGKPVFLLNMKVKSKSKSGEEGIPVFDLILSSDTLWYVAGDRNLLGTIKKDGTPGEYYQIPGEDTDGFRLYNSMVLANNKLYLIPYFAKEIAIFDLESKKFQKIGFKNPVKKNFVKGCYYKNKIFLVPAFYGAILQLNCDDDSLTYYYEGADFLKYSESGEQEPFCFNGACIEQEELLMAGARSNTVYSFNMENGGISEYKVGEKNDNYWGMTGRDGLYYLVSNHGRKITRWDKKEQKVESVELPSQFQGTDRCFISIVGGKKDVYVFPKKGSAILAIDIDSGKARLENFELPYREGERKSEVFSWVSNYYFAKPISDNTIIAMSAYDNSCICFERGDITPDKFYIKIARDDSIGDMPALFGRKGKNLPYAMRESKIFSVKEFADYVCMGLHQNEEQIKIYGQVSKNLDGSSGTKIHKFMMEVLELQ